MYAFSSKSGSEPFRALGDLTWNDPILSHHEFQVTLNRVCYINFLREP